jgi:PAS domain S-box-containing protein
MSSMETTPNAALGDGSDRVLLLLEPGQDRTLFAERLDDHEVLVGDPAAPLPEFDLCLVDTGTYPAVEDALAELKAATATYLPVLLVIGPDAREGAVRETASVADDVLPLPTTGAIFRSRVESLLRARRQSLELDAQRERFRSLAASAPNPIVTIDADGVVRFVNAAIERVFGHEAGDVVGEPLTSLMPERFREPHEGALERYLETGEPSFDWTGIRFQGLHADGHEVPLLVSFAEHRVGGERRITGVMEDVTEQIEREAELERTLDLLDRSQTIADIGGWEVDTETMELVWTDQLFDILGLPAGEEPPLDEALEFYHPEDRPAIEAAIDRVLADGESFDLDLRVRRVDGEVRWVRTVGEPVTVDGEVEAFRGIFQDITERRERQAELERTVDLLDKTGTIADVGGWENDYATGEVVWTKQIYDLLDLSREYDPELDEIIEFYHPEDRDAVAAAGERALEAGEPYDLEVRMVTAEDRERWVRLRGERAEEDGQVLRGTVQDITDRKEREAERKRLVRLFEKVQDLAGIGAWEWDRERDAVTWTDEVYDVYGYDPGEIDPDPELVLEGCHPEDRDALRAAVERAVETGEGYDIEVRVQRPDDTERWVHVHGATRTVDDEVVGLYGTIQDITDRIERTHELERYETVLETVPEAAWIFDRDRRLVFANSQMAEVVELTRAEVLGEPLSAFADTLFPDRETYESYVDTVDAILAGEREDARLQFTTRTVDGPVVTETRLVPLLSDDGVAGVVGLARDVTERVERERELERAVDMLDRAEEVADVGGWQYDPESGELLWTEQVYRIHQVDRDHEPDLTAALEFYHPEDRPAMEAAVERALEDGEPFDLELRIVRPGGEERWVRAIGEAETVDGQRVLRGTVQDIHERKQRERELERAVEQLEQTRDIADVGGWEYDPESGEMWWDEDVHEIYGQPETFDPGTGEAVLELYEPDARVRMETAMRRTMVDREAFDLELPLATEPTRWVRVTGAPQVEDDELTAVRGVVRDVTGRKRREQFLERYERIVETASDPIYTLDDEFRFTLLNDAAVALSERSESDLLGEHAATLFGETHTDALADATTRLIGSGRGQTTVETTVLDASGAERRYQTAVSPKPGGDGFRGVVCVSHDITDLTEHERRLSVLDRVIRHNLRNKMNVVLAQAGAIRERAAAEELVAAAAGIEGAAEELLSLGEGAREFHTALDPGATEFVEPGDVAEHARHVVEEARLSYDDATVEADLPAHAWARAHQEFELALSELVDNAATHGGPGVTVRVSVTATDDEVVVRVADDGPGIPDLERTAISAGLESPLQHATGLGLWLVQWTVTNSGGSMSIADREGGGAVVELRLPATEPPV